MHPEPPVKKTTCRRGNKMKVKMKNITDFVFRRQVGSKDVQSYHKSVESLLEFKATTPHANEPCELSGHCRATFLMDFSPDGSRMASSHGDHTVRITDLSTRKCTHILRGHPRTPWCLAFHQSSNDILASGCLGGEVRIWDLHGRGSEVWTAPHGSVIATLAFHPTDHVLVFATADEIYFWDWSKSRPFACCKTARNFERVRWLRFDPLGHYLYTGIANATTIQPRIHIGNRSTSGLRTDIRNRRRHIQERYQEVLRQYHSYERTQPELSVSIDPPAPSTIPLDEELVPYVNLVTPQSPVHEDNLRSARQYAAEISEAVRGALEIPFTRFSLRHYQERPRRQQEFLGASSQSAFYTPAPASSTSSSSLSSSSSSSFSGSAAAASANSSSVSDNDFSVGAVESLTLNDDAGYSRPSRSSESFQNGTPTPSTSGSAPAEATSNRNHSDVRFTGLDDIYRPVPSEFFRPSRLLSWQPSQCIRRDVVYKSSAAGSSDQNDSESSSLPTVHSSSSSISTSTGSTHSAASASTSSTPCTDHKKPSSASVFQSRNYYNFLDQELSLGNSSKSSKTTASKSSSSSNRNNNDNSKNTKTARQSRVTLFKLHQSSLPSSTSTNGSVESVLPESTDLTENSLLGHSSNSMNDSKPSTSSSTNFSTEHCNSVLADNKKGIDSAQESVRFMQCKRSSSPGSILSVSSTCIKCNSSPVSQNLVNGLDEKRDTVPVLSDSFAKPCCCAPTSVTPVETRSHPVNSNQPSCSRLSKTPTSNGPSSQNTVSPMLASALTLLSENKSEENSNRLEPVAETSLSSGEQDPNSSTSDRNQSIKNNHSEKTEDDSALNSATDQRGQNVCDHSEGNQSSTNQPKERNSAAIRHILAQNSRRLATLASMPLFPPCMRNRPKRPHHSDPSDENQQSKFPRTDNNNQSSGRHALFIPRILPLRSFLRYESSLSNRAPDESGASSSTTSVEDPSLPAGPESSSRNPLNNPSTLSTAASGSNTATDMESEGNDTSASQFASSPSSAAGSTNGPARTSSVSPFRSISMNNGLPRNLSDRLDACKMNLQILETLNSTYRENPSSNAASSSSSFSISAPFTPNTDSRISPPPPLPDSAAAAGCSDPSQRSTLLHNVFSPYPSTSSSLPSSSSLSSSSSSVETNSYLIGLPSSGTSSQHNGTLANNLPSTSRGVTGASCSRESASATSSNSNSIKPYQRQAGSLKSAFHSICRALSMSSTSPTSTENTYTSLQTPTTSLTSSTGEELISTAKPTCKVTSSCNKRTNNSDVAVTAASSSSCKQKSEMTNSAKTPSKWNNDLTAEATSSSSDMNADNNCWRQMSRLTPANVEAADGASSSSSADSNQPTSPSNSSSIDSASLLPPPAPPPLPPPPPYSPSINSLSSFPPPNRPMKTTASHSKEPILCSTSQNSSSMNTGGLTAPALLSVASTSISTVPSSSTGTCCSTKPSQNKMETDVSPRDSLASDQSISKPPHTTAGSYFSLNSFTDKVCPIESSACVTSSSSVHRPYISTSQPQSGDAGRPENCSDLETSRLSLSGDRIPHKSSVSNQSDQLRRTQLKRPTSKTSRVKLLKSVPSSSAASPRDCKSGTSFLTKDKLECDKSSSLSPNRVSEAGASSQTTHSMTQINQSAMHQHSPSGSTSAGPSSHNPDYGPNSDYQSDPPLTLLNWDELDSSSADSTNSHPTSAMRPPSHTYDIPVFEPSSMVSNRTSTGSLSDVPGLSRTLRPQSHSAREFESPSFTIPNINDNPGAATNEAFDTLCAVASATCDITEVTARLHQELDDLDRRMASLQQRCAARLARVHVPSREVVGLERWSANHNVDEFVCSVRNTLDGIAQLRRHERLVQQTAAASLYPDDINGRLNHGRGNEKLDESARLSHEAREEISRSLRREISKQTKLLRLQERILQRLRQRQIHQHYVNTTSSSEDTLPRPSDTLQAAINRAIAGAFLGRGEIAVATNIINLTHRIQRWDFRKLELPDLTDISDNVIVSHCKLHNDASCDISQDGRLLATFVPTHRGFPDDTVLAIYSLQEDTLGQCLYTKGFGPNAISVSISPKNHYVLVGLAAKRISWVFTTNQMVAQVYELSQEFAGEQSMKHVNDITHYVDADMRTHVSVNSAKWLPQVGGGLVYGTNRGNLHLCWPGFKPQKKENATERDEEWNTLNQAQSLRRNLYRVQHIRRNLINMPNFPQRLLHTTSTATQTSHRQVQRSAGTQTDGSEEEEGNWDSD